ncbi:MAG TPA: hypothetical protein DCS30_02795 [Rhizobiales bacterium]|nr:hypothetical protein [Hyphomicrobiales bacterium]
MTSVAVEPKELLAKLGIQRVIWIDDLFETAPDHLLEALMRTPNLCQKSDALNKVVEMLDEDGEPLDYSEFERVLTELLQELSRDDLNALNEMVRNQAASDEGAISDIPSPPTDLRYETADALCDILGVEKEDCLGFEAGLGFINNSENELSNSAILVDMQNAMQSPGIGENAGLGILRAFYNREDGGMVFVLTHEANAENESEKENELVERLGENQRYPCVVSKSRVQNTADDELSKSLTIALKRSALRREIFNVGTHVQKAVVDAVVNTQSEMCRIPPEELDHVFVQRAIREGVSDLHMIERIISAQVSKSVKEMFVQDQEMHSRMRMLRGITIGAPTDPRQDVIEKFRYDEIWDSGDFLTTAHAPLGVGDVFETMNGDTKRRFILLGQPCDIALRKNGKRSGVAGDLLSFSEANGKSTSVKTTDLLVGEGGQYLRFDFRHVAPAQLNILDLATLNSTGEVAISSDQDDEYKLLPGQAIRLKEAKKMLKSVKDAIGKSKDKPAELRKADARCKLTLQHDGHFKSVCTPDFSEDKKVQKLSWNLKRIGRLQSPFVDQLMDNHLAHLSRRAFEIDYLDRPEPTDMVAPK